MCERSGDWIYEWCRLSVSPSRRVWQTGREDAAAADRTVHWYNRWIPLKAGSLYKWGRKCAPELTHWPPVITPREFRWTEGLWSRKRLSIEREDRRILYLKFASYIDYILCTSRIVAVVNLFLKSASGGNNGVTSLTAVSVYWSVRACEWRASTLSWCHQRLIEPRPSFISPCYGLLC